MITMVSGQKHWAAGYASCLIEQVNEARQNGKALLAIERDTIPTGQMMYLDPTQIESMKDD